MMKKIRVGLIGLGTVGSGVLKLLRQRKSFFAKNYQIDIEVKKVCDKVFRKNDIRGISKNALTKNFQEVVETADIDVVIELIGGLHPAKEIAISAFKNKKHLISANKELIAHYGEKLFKLATKHGCHMYFESAVGAGVPIINTIENGLAGNTFKRLYGIVNGTCNYVLTQMTRYDLTFKEALEDAQKKGYAERDPSLDIRGMDSAHKLAILIWLGMGKLIPLRNIHVEGISCISPVDIEYAKEMGLVIKLLAIAKKEGSKIEARVHPTMIDNEHPLASVSGVFNALFMDADPLGDVLLYGQGAGQMAAASGVISDLLNLAAWGDYQPLLRILSKAKKGEQLKVRKMDEIETRFYLRCLVEDKPGVLSKISGILGCHGVSIDSVSQRRWHKSTAVPIVMLTHQVKEKYVRQALEQIHKLSVVKAKPVAIRMENLL